MKGSKAFFTLSLRLCLFTLALSPAVASPARPHTTDQENNSQLHSSHPASSELSWQQWKARYGKAYPDSEREDRARALWRRHWGLVERHNNRSDVTFTLELNAFADQEFSQEPRAVPVVRRVPPEVTSVYRWPQAPPTSFDWRQKGIISPVKNQGQLGSSAALAVTEDLQSLHARRTGQLVGLSAQEVVDCCSETRTSEGGILVPNIYECIAQHGGLCSDASYPVHPPSPSPVCRNNTCQAVAKDATKTVAVPKGDEDAMIAAVLRCPLVVYVDASHPSFQLYRSGVYSDSHCGHTLDHAMQLVGYGVQEGHPYWILRNSWGETWGMRGYILMERGVNMCGVADRAFYPQ
ncbi:procathepsin L-like isoform X2 [Babylonia areolata]